MAAEISMSLAQAIQDGTFPDSEELLRSDISSSIPRFLETIQASYSELDVSVKTVSSEIAGSVDSWIVQAEKIQKDIIRCKQEATQIVQEHEKILARQTARNDAQSKVSLLQEEVSFNEILEQQIGLLNDAFQNLNLLDEDIRRGRLVPATKTASHLRTSIESISSVQSQSLLFRLESQLYQDLRKKLEGELMTRCCIDVGEQSITLRFSEHHDRALDIDASDNQVSENNIISSDAILTCLEELNVAEEVSNRIIRDLQNSLLPHLRKASKLKISAGKPSDKELSLLLTRNDTDAISVCSTCTTVFHYLNQYAPRKLIRPLISALATKVVPLLVVDWLDPAVPVDLESIKNLERLLVEVRALAAELKQSSAEQSNDLEAWINQLPRTWASRRRMQSLDAVRQAFQKSAGSTRQAERVEKQKVVIEPARPDVRPADDDWAENWDDVEEKSATVTQTDPSVEDDADAWGFDTAEDDEVEKSIGHKNAAENEDTGEAWGWDDDDGGIAKEAADTKSHQQQPKANGVEEKDVVLTENYAVTDISDHILDQISRDVTDFEALQASPSTYFKFTTSTSIGISPQSLPTSILAMFRATAPMHYQTSSLSSMNLYNDTLYLTDKLSVLAVSMPGLKASLEKDISTLAKFARTTYTTELTLQRTILYDLLDSAQGFVSCTRPPYAQVCEDAISSVTDYLRSLHRQWEPILSLSHLRQAIGSLLSGIMAKMITDIEDMEDISEPESQKLVSFCERVTALQDLFPANSNANMPSPSTLTTADPNRNAEESESGSQIALYVPAYLRFAYFQQILGGSLADIRYFWEEGGLSLEFTADEIVDLIEALFAQSVHRKNAIKAIRG